MKLWHGLILIGVAVVTAIVSRARLASAETVVRNAFVPTSPATGDLPDVPGLRDRETKEPGFIDALLHLYDDVGADETARDHLTALMSEESNFDPQAGTPTAATGLLQWMPKYSLAFVGYSTDDIYKMTALEQLELVRTSITKKPSYLTDPPLAGWGSHAGAPDDTVIATQGEETYAENANYDKAKKGTITAGDVRAAVYGRLDSAKTKPRIGSGRKAVA